MDKEFISDFAVILHSHSSALINIWQWLEPVKEFLGINPFKDFEEITDIEVEEVLMEPISDLNICLGEIIEMVDQNWKEREISESLKEELFLCRIITHNYMIGQKGKRFKVPYLFSHINTLYKMIPNRTSIKLSKEIYSNLIYKLRDIHRIICYYDLLIAINKIKEMEYQTKNLMDFYSSNKIKEEFQILPISQIVLLTMRDKGGYAHKRNIEIRYQKRINNKVKVKKNDIIRAFSHLLNNAIKYNYQLVNNLVWVEIRSYIENNSVIIEFENWGTPITQEELSNNLIFRVGWRGTYANIKGMSGHGIGLADADLIIRDHGGAISILSVPAKAQNSNEYDYTKPFLTTVKVTLPKYD